MKSSIVIDGGFALGSLVRKYAVLNAVSCNPEFKNNEQIRACFTDELFFNAIDNQEALQVTKAYQERAVEELKGLTGGKVTEVPQYFNHLFWVADETKNDFRKVQPETPESLASQKQNILSNIASINDSIEMD